MTTLDTLLVPLRSISESTRLRILAVLLNGELTVSELTEVLDQSQPRVSRHLKLLSDAGVVERHQEGAWVFYRLADHPLIEIVRGCMPKDDHQLQQDMARLQSVRAAHRERATSFFQRNAAQWDCIRERHVCERLVERRLMDILGKRTFRRHVDLGTGTGRILQLLASRTRAAVGIDNSREMLAVARANLAGASFVHCQARHGDILKPDMESRSADLVTLHYVLHYLDNPAAAVAEAARIVDEDGIVLIVDFAPHGNESLRTDAAHRRLGFQPNEVRGYLEEAGLVCTRVETVDEGGDGESRGGDRLKVNLWVGAHATPRAAAVRNRSKEAIV